MKDPIERQTAIDAVAKWLYDVFGIKESDGTVTIFKRLRDLPSAQPEQRWIPVTERLPEKPNMYTVTDSKGDVVRFVYTGTKSSRKYWLRCAIAWMPQQEPYKGEQK